MAKKTTRVKPAPQGEQSAGVSAVRAAENRLEDFADDLGRLLGHAQNKAASWLEQRKAIAAHLTTVRDTAASLLAQIGLAEPARGRRAQQPAARRGPGRPPMRGGRKRTMSAEARAKISAAQKARWAKQKRSKAE
jgi:hypothetical protein